MRRMIRAHHVANCLNWPAYPLIDLHFVISARNGPNQCIGSPLGHQRTSTPSARKSAFYEEADVIGPKPDISAMRSGIAGGADVDLTGPDFRS